MLEDYPKGHTMYCMQKPLWLAHWPIPACRHVSVYGRVPETGWHVPDEQEKRWHVPARIFANRHWSVDMFLWTMTIQIVSSCHVETVCLLTHNWQWKGWNGLKSKGLGVFAFSARMAQKRWFFGHREHIKNTIFRGLWLLFYFFGKRENDFTF